MVACLFDCVVAVCFVLSYSNWFCILCLRVCCVLCCTILLCTGHRARGTGHGTWGMGHGTRDTGHGTAGTARRDTPRHLGAAGQEEDDTGAVPGPGPQDNSRTASHAPTSRTRTRSTTSRFGGSIKDSLPQPPIFCVQLGRAWVGRRRLTNTILGTRCG